MIIFFPSYNFLRAVKAAWLENGKLEKLRDRKEVSVSYRLTEALHWGIFRYFLSRMIAKM